MRAKDLVGRTALRTAPGPDGDRSYMGGYPVKIASYCKGVIGIADPSVRSDRIWYLSPEWDDDKWIEIFLSSVPSNQEKEEPQREKKKEKESKKGIEISYTEPSTGGIIVTAVRGMKSSAEIARDYGDYVHDRYLGTLGNGPACSLEKVVVNLQDSEIVSTRLETYTKYIPFFCTRDYFSSFIDYLHSAGANLSMIIKEKRDGGKKIETKTIVI